MQRRTLLIAGAAASLASGLRAQAAWPAQPIKLMIAFPPGGPTDLTMRALAENASKLLGQPVVIENRPGAGGTLPAQALQQAKPDGYTLAQIPLGVFRLPYTTKISWDPVKDISYILGIELNHIPFGGSADMMQSILGRADHGRSGLHRLCAARGLGPAARAQHLG